VTRSKQLLSFSLFLILGLGAIAQLEPNLEYPAQIPSSFESLQSSGFIKSLTDFRMNAPVKSVDETVTYLGEKESKRVKRTQLEFNKKGLLTLYENDTTSSRLFTIPDIKKYEFDETNVRLMSYLHYHGMPQNHSTTVSSFDETGFLSETVYKCTTCGLYTSRDTNRFDFDYTLTYSWNQAYDTVLLDYEYVTDCTTWSRRKDGMLLFPKKTEEIPEDNIYFYPNGIQDFYETDSNGNITRITSIDNTIKSSFNIDIQTDYEYNKYQELVSIKQYSNVHDGHSGDTFNLDMTTMINYLEIDVHQNWLKMKVTRYNGNGRSTYSTTPTGGYLYERKIVYYQALHSK
jgi:hypothetical protein